MNINKLIGVLAEIAENDLTDGNVISEHPCSLAITAINVAFIAGHSLGYDKTADIYKVGEQLKIFKEEAEI
jgi:hypothetical protein